MAKWTSLTARIKKVKDGGRTLNFKDSKQEIAFGKLVANMKVPQSLEELQKEAYITAPELVKKRKELLEHQEANIHNPKYQALQKEKKAQRKLNRKQKTVCVGE